MLNNIMQDTGTMFMTYCWIKKKGDTKLYLEYGLSYLKIYAGKKVERNTQDIALADSE